MAFQTFFSSYFHLWRMHHSCSGKLSNDFSWMTFITLIIWILLFPRWMVCWSAAVRFHGCSLFILHTEEASGIFHSLGLSWPWGDYRLSLLSAASVCFPLGISLIDDLCHIMAATWQGSGCPNAHALKLAPGWEQGSRDGYDPASLYKH